LGERKFAEMHGVDIRGMVGRLISLYQIGSDAPSAPEADHLIRPPMEEQVG
jgi:hypothetical protein